MTLHCPCPLYGFGPEGLGAANRVCFCDWLEIDQKISELLILLLSDEIDSVIFSLFLRWEREFYSIMVGLQS